MVANAELEETIGTVLLEFGVADLMLRGNFIMMMKFSRNMRSATLNSSSTVPIGTSNSALATILYDTDDATTLQDLASSINNQKKGVYISQIRNEFYDKHDALFD